MENKAVLKARKVSLLISDVDGVLTDGKLFYGPDGRDGHSKAFHVRDGLAVKLAQMAGIRVAFVSAKKSEALKQRAAELNVDFCKDGVSDKILQVNEICDTLQVSWAEIAAIGDDLVDLPVLRRCGFAATVPEAPAEVRSCVDFVTTHPGGEGAFREFVEFLIRSRGRWDDVIAHFGGVHEIP